VQLIIAEKPSVAREIARLLGAAEKKEGYIAGKDYCVTWTLGHLVTLAMPEDYGIAGFQKAALPILPNPFKLTVRKKKHDKGYTLDQSALKQLKIIEQLLKKCDSIIAATDAGREGELIFRYIYAYLKCKLPFQRLWISLLTEKAIKQGFDNLKPGHDFEGLYHAARITSSFQGITSSFQGITSSFQGITSSFQGMTSSFQGMTYSFQGMTYSFQGITYSFQGMTSSFQEMTSSFQEITYSFQEITYSFQEMT
jgi:hypothetical protein